MKLGKKLEGKAEKYLIRRGFKNIHYQKQYQYKLAENGTQKVIKIIPDFTATKRGKFCVIEVKAGQSAPSVYNESTRRQLLEYNHALHPDQLYLLDMGKREIKEIRF
jgi:Holliday junction resolvase